MVNTLDMKKKHTNLTLYLCIFLLGIIQSSCSKLDETIQPKEECKTTSFSIENLKLNCPINRSQSISWTADLMNNGTLKAKPTITTYVSKSKTIDDSSVLLGVMNASSIEAYSKNFDIQFTCNQDCTQTNFSITDFNYIILSVQNQSEANCKKENDFTIIKEIPSNFTKKCEEAICENSDLGIVESQVLCKNANQDLAWKYKAINTGNVSASGKVRIWLSKDKKVDTIFDILVSTQELPMMKKNEIVTISNGSKLANYKVSNYQFILIETIGNYETPECNTTDNIQTVSIPKNYSATSCPAAIDTDCYNLNFSQLQYLKSSFSETPIVISNNQGIALNTSSVILFETNEGRLGFLEILSIKKNHNFQTKLKATVFNSDGTVFSKKDEVTIHAMKFFDLDNLTETNEINKADFLWKKLGAIETNLIPYKGSKYKICIAK